MALSKQQAPTRNLRAFLAHAASMDYHVGEHPAYGGVTRSVHVPGSWHNDGKAADINWLHGGSERAHLLRLIPVAESYGLGLTFARDGVVGSAANHRGHLHVDVGQWSNYGRGPVRAKRATRKVPAGSKSLATGSRGNRVKRLQHGLNVVFPAYADLDEDGVFGELTEAVVREFQRRAGIKDDGIVGPVTRGALAGYGIKL